MFQCLRVVKNKFTEFPWVKKFLFYFQLSRDDQEDEVGVSSGAAEGSISSGDVDDCFDGKETDKDSKKKKNRCALCRKKVGLTGA